MFSLEDINNRIFGGKILAMKMVSNSIKRFYQIMARYNRFKFSSIERYLEIFKRLQ